MSSDWVWERQARTKNPTVCKGYQQTTLEIAPASSDICRLLIIFPNSLDTDQAWSGSKLNDTMKKIHWLHLQPGKGHSLNQTLKPNYCVHILIAFFVCWRCLLWTVLRKPRYEYYDKNRCCPTFTAAYWVGCPAGRDHLSVPLNQYWTKTSIRWLLMEGEW